MKKRWRGLRWFVLAGALAGGVALWIHRSGVRPASPTPLPSTAASAPVPPPGSPRGPRPFARLSPAGGLATPPSPAAPAPAAARPPRFPYRLSNTPEPLDQLSRRDHALLLANALIDTARGTTLPIPSHLRAVGDPGAYVVQARGALTAAFRQELAAAGASIVSYIPNNAYLVQLSAAGAQALAGDPSAQAVLPYEPYYKLAPALLALAVPQKPMPPNSGLNLTLFPGARTATIAALAQLGAAVFGEGPSPFGPVLTVQAPADSLPALAQLPGVQLIEQYQPVTPANDLSRVRMGVATDTVTNANWLGLTGANVLVNVTDSGVDATHPDLAGRVIGDLPISLVDTNGHGTHVAGIIAGSGDHSPTVTVDSNGVANVSGSVAGANFRGKAPGARLFSMATDLNAGPGQNGTYYQQTAALTNVLISNNSWSYGNANDYTIGAASYDAAVRDALPAVPGSQPLLFVFPAGNSGGANSDGLGGNPGSILSPGTAKNVITVGALEQLRNITNETVVGGLTNQAFLSDSDSDDQVAEFSGRGNVSPGIEGDYGRFKPDVVAPGTFVVSTRSAQWDTAAYYNPTNYHPNAFLNQIVPPNTLNNYSLFVPDNAVAFTIAVSSNRLSTGSFPNLPIFVKLNDMPTATSYDFVGTNQVSIPPDQPLATGTSWYYSVGNPTAQPVSFDLTTELVTTNDNGNYYDVLRSLNGALGPYYRYESGTSMAAADVSGMLALMQEFFEQRLHVTNSPALMKALLINGARSAGLLYDFEVRTGINHQGWGLPRLPTTLPALLAGGVSQTSGTMLLFDQSPTNALATGDSQTRTVTVSQEGQGWPLRITLVWTDPPGNPAASLKLVNDLDLIVTNLDTGEVYYGNDIPAGSTFNEAWDTNAPPVADNVNNVENVYLTPLLATNGYAITVYGRRVNVNAVTAHTNNVVQDYALVISSGDGYVTNALTLTEQPRVSASLANVTFVPPASNGIPFLDQRVGANSPLLATNAVTNVVTSWGTNAIFLGLTNQWNFYVVTNSTGYTNAAFVTFEPPTLSLPRIGVQQAALTNTSRLEADIDLYVSGNAGLTNLDPAAITASDKSLGRGGTEVLVYSNSAPGQVYYVGVKSEDYMAAEYGFVAVFSQQPFALNSGGNTVLQGLPVPAFVPDGSPENPGAAFVFAIDPSPMKVRRVVVTNIVTHQNFGDLSGNLSHNQTFVVLNNHDSIGGVTNALFAYEDNGQGDIPGALHTDGPGSLTDFIGQEGAGLWLLSMVDNSLDFTGQVNNLFVRLDPQPENTKGIITVVAGPNGFYYDFVDVPPNATNLTVTILPNTLPLQLYLRRGALPTLTTYDKEADIPPNLGGSLSIGLSDVPPLSAGRYYIGIYNPNSGNATISYIVTVGLGTKGVAAVDFTSTVPTPILDDAVTDASIFVTNDQPITTLDVGVRLDHPRVSDLALTLISPSGTRVLLDENRGGWDTNGLGRTIITTNLAPITFSGGPRPTTNALDLGVTSGTLTIDDNFGAVPDTFSVFYESNRVAGPTTLTNTGTLNLAYGPGTSTVVTIVVNEAGNTNAAARWSYTVSSTQVTYLYTVFTENTNLTTTPMKFAVPPFAPSLAGLTNASSATNALYFLPEQPLDAVVGASAFGQWTLELWDSRVGATNPPPMLVSWQLAITFANTAPVPIGLTHGLGVTNTLAPHAIQYFTVDVPSWARFATNHLWSASAPVNLLFNQSALPTGTNAGDLTLLTGVRSGTVTLTTNGVPPLRPGQRYNLGLQNLNATNVTYAFEVDFDITSLANGVPVTGTADTPLLPRYFQYDASANATALLFALTNLSGNVDLVARRGPPLPTLAGFDYLSANPGAEDEAILVLTNSTPVPASPGRWYLGVFNNDVGPVTYTIVAVETTNLPANIITLTNGVPYTNRNAGGSSPADYYRYPVTTNAVRAQFEINHPSGPVALVARRGFPPLPDLTHYDYLSANGGTNDDLIVVFDFSQPVPLTAGDWYLSAVDLAGAPVAYAIKATEWPEDGTNITVTCTPSSSNSFCLTWNSLIGAHYYVQGRPDLGTPGWTTISPTITATSTQTTWCVSLPSPYRYFRVREGLAVTPLPALPVRITSITAGPGGVVLRWTGSTNQTFHVQWAGALTTPLVWNTFPTVVTSTTGQFSFTDDGTQSAGLGPRRFYRLTSP